MAPSQSTLLLFGDQTGDIVSATRELLSLSAHSPPLRSFIQRAEQAIQREGRHHQHHLPADLLSASSLLSLAAATSATRHPAIRTLLFTVVQLGNLIYYAEKRIDISTSTRTTKILASCTGLLPAAVIATSRSLAEIVDLSTAVVVLALKVGLAAARRSETIEENSERKSWAVAVAGVHPEQCTEILKEFHEANNTSSFKSAYISAVSSDTSITVSGPPSTLALLFAQRREFRDARSTHLPLTTAFHASHLPLPDVASLIDQNEALFNREVPEGLPAVISPSTGEPIVSKTVRGLFTKVIEEIFQWPIDWPTCKATVVSSLAPGVPVSLISVGPAATSNVLQSIRHNGFHVEETEIHSRPNPTLSSDTDNNSIAIVGMSGRFPGSTDLDEFWSVLEKGLALDRPAPAERHADGFHGCFIDNPGAFDCRMFNMSPREAIQTDPGQRLLLMTAYEALEMAGYNPAMLRRGPLKRVGTFIGQTVDNTEIAGQDADINYVTGNIRAFASGRLNYHFKWDGPSLTIDTACSSSLVAIETACQKLLANDCDMAVAGGSNILAGQSMFTGLTKGSFLSPTGSCKTFDNDADGYCRGDGVGCVVLKRFPDALADGDNILGLVRAAATNHSSHASSITHPHCETQKELFREVLAKAGLEAADIDYVELHGTGTQAGDATEFESVASVLGQHRSEPLCIGGLKPNIGHAEASAGLGSVIKAVMMFEKGVAPPHIGIKGQLNEKLDMSRTSIKISQVPSPFVPGPGRKRRRVLVNNFSAAGGNTSLVLEDAPEASVTAIDPRTAFPVVLSAKTEVSLARNIENLAKFLVESPQTPLSHISYTTTARKPMHHPLRKSFVAKDTTDLLRLLSEATTSNTSKAKRLPSIGFAFTGQGSLFAGMGLELFRSCQSFRDKILESHNICASLGFPSWLELVSEEQFDLEQATVTQANLALVSVEVAIASMWQSWGLRPSVCIGHSLGEYAALCVTGAISLYDMLYLVGKRAQLLEQTCPPGTHSMLALRCSAAEAHTKLAAMGMQDFDTTCINGPESTVIGGSTEKLAEVAAGLKSKGTACKLLPVAYAFHSKQMEPILSDFALVAASVTAKAPKVPVASTVTGTLISPNEDGVLNPNFFCRQTRDPVQFVQAAQSCTAAGLADENTIWIEMGPGRVLLDLLKGALGPAAPASPRQLLPSIQKDQDSWITLSKALAYAYEAGLDMDWLRYHEQYVDCLRIAKLPTYAFDTKNYWMEPKTKDLGPSGLAAEVRNGFSTTCLHRIEAETVDPGISASVTFVSNLADPRLGALARGHLVCGKGLVPSSVYAEMALSAASYVHSKVCVSTPAREPVMNLSDMHIFKPLIALPGVESQTVKVECETASPAGPVRFTLSSQDLSTKEWTEHARCSVLFSDGSKTLGEWRRNAYLVKDRWQHMTTADSADRLSRRMVYRLFKTVVTYAEPYHTLREVYMDDQNFEMAAHIKFDEADKGFNGTYSPHWIDCLAQTGGLALNADPKIEGTVYLSTGWSTMEILTELTPQVAYRAHVRMLEVKKDQFEGDVYLFDGDSLAAVCLGLRFQRMRMATLQAILGASSASGHAHAPVAGPAFSRKQPQIVSPSSAAPASCSSDGELMAKVKAIICEEAGLEATELGEDVDLADVGIDSILTISILNKLRDLTSADLPSSLFSHHPTIRDLRSFFKESTNPAPSTESKVLRENITLAEPIPITSSPSVPQVVDEIIAQILNCIAEQAGLDITDLSDSADFGDLGIDSILTISILVEIRTLTGLDLPSSLFTTHPTVSSLLTFLEAKLGGPSPLSSSDSTPAGSSPLSTPGSTRSATPMTESAEEVFRSSSILLQGQPKPSQPALFLLPDGSGSALSYLELQSLGGTAVYALNSPFLKCPLEYTVDHPFQKVASMYIAEIRRVQPRGPYLIGGWSMGGIFAFEVTRQLLARGEAIKALLLLDSPCPRTLPPLPAPTLTVLERAGLFAGLDRARKGITEATRQHFVACVRCLEHFTPQPIAPALAAAGLGPVAVVWARDGVLEGVDEETKRRAEEDMVMTEGEQDAARAAKAWLMGKREYGPAGWDQLIGKEVSCEVVAGNHFSMMKPPFIGAVGDIVGRVVRSAVA